MGTREEHSSDGWKWFIWNVSVALCQPQKGLSQSNVISQSAASLLKQHSHSRGSRRSHICNYSLCLPFVSTGARLTHKFNHALPVLEFRLKFAFVQLCEITRQKNVLIVYFLYCLILIGVSSSCVIGSLNMSLTLRARLLGDGRSISVFTPSSWKTSTTSRGNERKWSRMITCGFRAELIRWPFSWGFTNTLIAHSALSLSSVHVWDEEQGVSLTFSRHLSHYFLLWCVGTKVILLYRGRASQGHRNTSCHHLDMMENTVMYNNITSEREICLNGQTDESVGQIKIFTWWKVFCTLKWSDDHMNPTSQH